MHSLVDCDKETVFGHASEEVAHLKQAAMGLVASGSFSASLHTGKKNPAKSDSGLDVNKEKTV